ncbi:MAG: N-formylglutamate amidohydrolase [Paracoccaceae bacterium]|nr:N-formylglutamate amidohydrolase [Paracoccaceae bacterium]
MTRQPYQILNETRASRFLLTCDHATNIVPPEINGGDLGLPADQMQRHIAYDIGAEGVTRHLSDLLCAPAIFSQFSRLVIDPNRGEDDPTLIMKVYDGTIIPANRHVNAAEAERRLNAYHRPYHEALENLAARRDDTLIVAIHSFTPKLYSRAPRPWHIGILHAWDERLSRPMLDRLYREADIVTGENEPYAGYLPGDSIDQHALQKNRPNALIELRQDLITDEPGQVQWAERLARILTDCLADLD